MNQAIVDYLKKNKDMYAKEALVAQLKTSGFSEGEIEEGVGLVYEYEKENISPIISAAIYWICGAFVYLVSASVYPDPNSYAFIDPPSAYVFISIVCSPVFIGLGIISSRILNKKTIAKRNKILITFVAAFILMLLLMVFAFFADKFLTYITKGL